MFEQVFNTGDFSKTQQQFQQQAQQATAVNTEVLEKLTRHNIESGTELLAGAVQHAEKLRAVKQPAEFIQLQTEYFQNATELGRNQWQKFTEILTSTGEQYKAMLEAGVDTLKETTEQEVKTSRRKKS